MSKNLGFGIRYAVIAFGGLIILIMGLKGIVTNFIPAKDLYSTDWSTLKSGQHIEVNLDFVIEPFEITTKDNKEYSKLYTIPDLQISDEDGQIHMTRYMGVKAFSSQFNEYENLVESSWKWWEDTTGTVELGEDGCIYVDGTLRKMTKKEKNFLYEYLTDWGIPESQAEEMITPYILVSNSTMSKNVITAVVGLAMLVIFGGLAVLMFVRRNV